VFRNVKELRELGPYHVSACGRYRYVSQEAGWCGYYNGAYLDFVRRPCGRIVAMSAASD
jgi:hypothetical protein